MSREYWRKPYHSYKVGQIIKDKDGFTGEIVSANPFMSTIRVRWTEGPMSNANCKPYVVGVHEVTPA